MLNGKENAPLILTKNESRPKVWRDLFWVPKGVARPTGLTCRPISIWRWVTPRGLAWLYWKSRHVHCRDWKETDLKINFCQVRLYNIIYKRAKIRKKNPSVASFGPVKQISSLRETKNIAMKLTNPLYLYKDDSL
jgi:hypothetical protein